MKKNWFIYFFEFIALLIFLVSVSVLYLNQTRVDFFNSDILALPDLFKDLAHGGHLQDWFIPTTPMFFPDWLIYSISYLTESNVYFQFLIIAGLNTLLLYWMLRLIYRKFFPRIQASVFSLVSLGFFLFFTTKILVPYVYLFAIGLHVGTFIIGLLYVFIQIQLIDTSEIRAIRLLVFFAILISLMAGASDLLFIIQFSLPVFFSYLLIYIKKKIEFKKIVYISFIPLCFSIFGGWAVTYLMPRNIVWNYLDHPSLRKISLAVIKNDSLFILNSFKGLMQFYWPILIYLIFYVAIICINLYILFMKEYYKHRFIILNKKNIFLSVFILFSIVLNILSLFTLSENVVLTQRYIEPLFFLPLLTFFYMGSFFNKNKIIFRSVFAFSFLVLVFLLLINLIFAYKNISNIKTNYYPDEIACIDGALQGHGRYGIADYWIARYFSTFSQTGLNIKAMTNSLIPFTMVANVKNFKSNYDFAIIYVNPPASIKDSVPDEKIIRKFNGEPEKVVLCGDKKLLIYPENSLRTPYFVSSGDEFIWRASELPSQFSNSVVLNTREVKEADGLGFVTFGPYVPLTAGKYRFYIGYSSNASADSQVAYGDIYSIKRGLLNVIPLFGTNSEHKQISGTLVVPANSPEEDNYQIRTYSSAHSKLTIEFIKLVKH